MSVNAHSSAENQAAAQTFVDFIARPQQNALFTKATGGLTPVAASERAGPRLHVEHADRVREAEVHHQRRRRPGGTRTSSLALQQNQIGLITGQRSIDDVLKAMDAAWQKGPS